MDRLVLLAVALCLVAFGPVHGYNVDERRLRHDLLSNYDKHTLPAASTTVKFGVTIKHFQMVEESQTLMVDSWMSWEWDDPRLQWNPRLYGNVTQLTVPNSMLWKPDLEVYNSANADESMSFGNTLVVLASNGHMLFVPPVKLHFACVMDLTYWPHDTHNCTCVFGSWVHDGIAIDVQNSDEKPDLDLPRRLTEDGFNLTRGTWDLVESSISRRVKTYNCCDEPYVTILMSMTVARNAPAYAWIIKGPAVGLSVLTLVIFLLPPAAGEKMIFGVLCLLLDMIFIAYSSFIIAFAPSHTPLIVKMVCKQVLLVIGSIVMCAVSLRMARDPHSTGLPPCIKRFLVLISTCLCLRNYKNLVSRAHHPSYSRTLKSDEFELRENGNGHVYTGEVCVSPGLDWLLLAAVLDRLGFIVFVVFFVIDMYSFSSVI